MTNMPLSTHVKTFVNLYLKKLKISCELILLNKYLLFLESLSNDIS